MIHLLVPAALWGLALALGPLLIHLLRRRRAHRVVVPTIRFVAAVSQSSVRLRPPDDLLLLALRTAIIVAAVLALAAPVVMTSARRNAWDGRIARAVVVDSSRSASVPERDRRAAEQLASAFSAVRIDSESIREGLHRAAAWISTAPPARDEIVVISDFHAGSLSAADLDDVPASVGVRFQRIPSMPVTDVIDDGLEVVQGRSYGRQVSIDGGATSLTLTPEEHRTIPLRIEGVPADVAGRLQRIVERAGVSFPSAGTTVVRFGTPASRAVAASPEAVAAATRLASDPRVAGIRFEPGAEADSLIIATGVDPASLEAATLVQAAVDAWHAPSGLNEYERLLVPDATLQSWTRPAQPVDAGAWRRTERTDARWLWLLALVLMGVEWRLRRDVTAEEASHARAA